jgi:hypothetical protein
MPPTALPRHHALDALRAAMMLLGLVLHSALSYVVIPLQPAWPYKDPSTSIGLDLLVFLIHLFRMPVFFVVAGFFAALLYHRDGVVGFVRNRAKRVLIPLLLFWSLMTPLTGCGFVFSGRQIGGPMPWDYMTDAPMWRQPILGHLWFLYYLLLFYSAALVLVPAARRAPPWLQAGVDQMCRAIATRWWGPLAAGVITTGTLIPMTTPGLDTEATLLPAVRVLVAYAVFFGFGWLLFRQRSLVEQRGRRWVAALTAAIAVALTYGLVLLLAGRFDDPRVWHVTSITLGGVATWLLIFGLIGLFVERLSAPRPIVRYLSDASYWMYLTHLAPAAWLPGVFAHLALPAVVKFTLVFAFTVFITVVTYHYLVRPTVIGELLNGRRYPRVTPFGALRPASPSSRGVPERTTPASRRGREPSW